jgi:hypothetical protein
MSELDTVLLECEYFPCIAWYATFMRAKHVQLEVYEFFERATLRNRCYISGPNGKLALSIPLQGGRNQQGIMKERKVCSATKWQQQHWRAIQSSYGRSPYFSYFEEALFTFFTTPFDYLVEVDVASIRLINSLIRIKKEVALSTSYQYPFNEGFDFRKQIKKNNLQPPTQIHYLQPFAERHGFIDGLSMLDLLFCCGVEANALLLK